MNVIASQSIIAVLSPLFCTSVSNLNPATIAVSEAGRVYDLARLTVHQAERLDGREAFFALSLDVEGWLHECWFIFGTFARVGAANATVAPVERSIWLRCDTDRHSLDLRGRLTVIRHQPRTFGGQEFEGFTEMRFIASP